MVFMRRALQLAEKGRGFTKSNPLVGAVIVSSGSILGEGYHAIYGGDHAEVSAIKSALARHGESSLKGATMYVNLEPCFHYGKTPPCVDKIIKYGFAEVVIAMKDPNPLVSGKSIAKLRAHGIEVKTGVMEDEARKLNETFIYFMEKGKPFVCMKSAMSLDGKIATASGDSKWISAGESRAKTATLRYAYQAIIVGINTVIADDPYLTTRIDGKPNPVKIIIDSGLRVPESANVLKNGEDDSTIIYCKPCEGDSIAKRERLSAMQNVNIIELSPCRNLVNLDAVMEDMAARGIASALLEGGGTLNFSMIKAGFVKKALFVIAPKIIGGSESKTPVMGAGYERICDVPVLRDISYYSVAEDLFVEGYF